MAWQTVFMDGFDHYATADVGAKWDNRDAGPTIDATIFRNSGQSMRHSGGAGYQTAKQLNIAAQNIVYGFGLYLQTAPSGTDLTSAGAVMLLANEGTFGGTPQFGIGVGADGHIRVGRITSTTTTAVTAVTLASGVATINAATWYYIEVRVFIHATAGAVEVRVNGVVDILLTGVNTKGSSTMTGANWFHLRGAASSAWYCDDLYIRTEASTSEVTGGFLGDIKIKPYYPNADGTYSAMTCSTGTTHNTLVKEALPNLTDYVYSSTALTKDSFNFQDAAETGSIKAVQLNAYCYKVDSGFRGADPFIKSGSTEVYGTSQPLSTTPKYVQKMFEQDPNTSADWSQANFNAAEFGVRISVDV
jgi:hypothetical protein